MDRTFHYSKNIPVADHFDVVICGGGPAGIGAAVAAAENDAKTALIERFGFLGGMATAGYVTPMSEFAFDGRRVIGGIPWRFVQELEAAGGAQVEKPRFNVSFDPEKYKLVAWRMVVRAGAECFMNTYLADGITDGGALRSVVVVNKSGMILIEGDYFIDATGDADLAHFAGVPMQKQTRDRQPGTLCFVLGGVDTSTERMHIIRQGKPHGVHHQAVFVREVLFALRENGVDVPQFGGPWFSTTLAEGCVTVNMTRSPMNSVDSSDYQRAEAKMREDAFLLTDLLRTHVPEFKNCYIASVATVAGIRESRRIRGVHTITGEEYVNAVRYPDSIARACHPIDIHLPGNDGQQLTMPKDAGYIPYRSLIAEGFPNLLVAGRCISADAEAFAAIRVQAPCMEVGQAAGLAAALCLQDGRIPVQKLDPEKLVRAVRDAKSLI